jgi:hypothetical protein
MAADDAEALDVLRRDRHTAEYGDFALRVIKEQRARDALAAYPSRATKGEGSETSGQLRDRWQAEAAAAGHPPGR